MDAGLLVAVLADELEESAVRILQEEGAEGVSLLPGRGIGFPEHVTFYGLTYRGLEIVLLSILPNDHAHRIAERLNLELDLLKPFRGLAFVWPVEETGGLKLSNSAAGS